MDDEQRDGCSKFVFIVFAIACGILLIVGTCIGLMH